MLDRTGVQPGGRAAERRWKASNRLATCLQLPYNCLATMEALRCCPSAAPVFVRPFVPPAARLTRILLRHTRGSERRRCRPLPPCRAEAHTYNAPMLDIKLIRERPDFVRQRLATRGAGDEARIDEVLKCDEQRRKFLFGAENLKRIRKSVSKEIGALIGQKKIEEAEQKKAEIANYGDQ